MCRAQASPLVDAAETQADLAIGAFAPQGRAAGAAEDLIARSTAVADLAVTRRLSACQAKLVRRGSDGDPVSSAGQSLTIRAVADADGLWIDLGFIADLSALA